MVIVVAVALVIWARTAAAEQLVSAEVLVAEPPLISARGSGAAAASDGTDHLVVWSDNRSGYFSDIYGARVTASGEVLDPVAFPISRTIGSDLAPVVVFGGELYLVVWEAETEILAARVTRDGTVLDPEGISVAPIDYRAMVDADFDGDLFRIAYGTYADSTFVIESATATEAGVIGGRLQVAVLGEPGYALGIACAAACAVVWDEKPGTESRVFARRVDPGSPPPVEIGDDLVSKGRPSIAADAAGFLVVWADGRTQQLQTYGRRLGTDLSPQGAADVLVQSAVEPLDLLAHEDGFAVLLGEPLSNYQLGVRPLSAAGVSTGQMKRFFPALRGPYKPAAQLVSSDTGVLAVWDGRDAVTAAQLDAQFAIDSEAIAVSVAGATQRDPAIATGAGVQLVVWVDERDPDGTDLYGARVAPDGSVLDTFAITTAPDDQLAPRAVFDGSEFVVAWRDHRNETCPRSQRGYGGCNADLYAAWIPPQSGAPVRELPLVTTGGDQDQMDLAAGTDGIALVWVEGDDMVPFPRPRAAGFSRDGTQLGDPLLVDETFAYHARPAIASDGAGLVVAWATGQSTVSGDEDVFIPSGYRIRAARLSVDASAVEAEPFEVAPDGGRQYAPAIAILSDGTTLLAWQEPAAGSDPDIMGALFAGGVLSEPVPVTISGATTPQLRPRVAAAGNRFFVIWEDRRGHPYRSDVYGTTVGADGVVEVATQVAVDYYAAERHPAIAALEDGLGVAVAYDRLDELGSGSFRAGVRLVGADWEETMEPAIEEEEESGCGCRSGRGGAGSALLVALAALLAASRRRQITALLALLLALSGCGDTAGHADGGADQADAGEVDAGPTGTIEVTVHGSDSVPAGGIDVLLHSAAGVLLDRGLTDADGRLTFASDGGMITALGSENGASVATTLAWVPAGSAVVIGPMQGHAPSLGTATMTLPGAFAGASSYGVSSSCSSRSAGLEPFEDAVSGCALGDGGAFRLLAVARDAGEPLAYSLFAADGFTTDISFPAWSTEVSTIPFTWSNVPAGLTVETGYAFKSAGIEFGFASEVSGPSGELVQPAALDGGLIVGAWAFGSTQMGYLVRSRDTIPSELAADFAADLPARPHTLAVTDSLTARPSLSWQFDAGAAPASCMAELGWNSAVWRVVVDGSAAPFRLPELPADQPQYQPGPGVTYREVFLNCYAASFLPDDLRPLDFDEVPRGEWEAAGWMTFAEL